MNADKLVWTELGPSGLVIRIFKSVKAAFRSFGPKAFMKYGTAVGQVRHQLWTRCRGFCEDCGSPVTEQSGHMHEKRKRGLGGEISLDNSKFICAACHTHSHPERRILWNRLRRRSIGV